MISNLSQAGITEEATNCLKDILDPRNRGSRCWLIENYYNLQYPACVGLSRIGKLGRVQEVWNHPNHSFVPTPWWMRLFPMSWIKWDREGVYIFKTRV